jgi:hypothetical protein
MEIIGCKKSKLKELRLNGTLGFKYATISKKGIG